jgi:hypothetical protein
MRIILKWMLKKWGTKRIDRCYLVEDRGQWQACVDRVRKLWIP